MPRNDDRVARRRTISSTSVIRWDFALAAIDATPIAPALVGANTDTCKAYFGYFLRHWSWRKDAFNDVLNVFVDNFLKPGNLEGGFAHYKGTDAGRIAMMKRGAQAASDRNTYLRPLG